MEQLFFSALLPEQFPEIYNQLASIPHKLLADTKDIWCRDYMPLQRMDGSLVGFRYNPSYLEGYEQTISDATKVWKELGLNVIYHTDITADGGHFQLAEEVLYVSEFVFNENPSFSQPALLERLKAIFQVNKVIVLPPQAGDFTGHLDGLLRFPDSKNRPIVYDYHLERQYNKRFYEQWNIHFSNLPDRLITWPYLPKEEEGSAVGCYLNYLEFNTTIYLPQYNLPEDQLTLEKLSEMLPSYSIIPIHNCNKLANKGGVLNCISWSYNK